MSAAIGNSCLAFEHRVRLGIEPWRQDRVDSDEALLARFLTGDEHAFERLVKRHRPDLLAFLERALGNHAAAEDVAQETFLRLYRAADRFQASRELRPWLFSIAANAARDHYRHAARRPAASLHAPVRSADTDGTALLHLRASDEDDAPCDRAEWNEERERVGRTIERMPVRLREIIRMAYFRQLSYNEMSEALGIPLGTVKSRLHAAVADFAVRWGDER